MIGSFSEFIEGILRAKPKMNFIHFYRLFRELSSFFYIKLQTLKKYE